VIENYDPMGNNKIKRMDTMDTDTKEKDIKITSLETTIL